MEPLETSRKSEWFRNPVSFLGAVLALLSLSGILSLLLLDGLGLGGNPYVGIIAYVGLPAILFLGLLLILAGIILERRRAFGGTFIFPAIDFNRASHRRVFFLFLAFMTVFLILTGVGSYKAYQFTGSVSFCGRVCHSVMKPEYTAYQASPHARVPCAECHVGPGAAWYVRSKVSGTYQLYAVAFNQYPRPIPSPIKNLRPARETCEHCHWPEKFWGDRFKVNTHYGTDEKNTVRQIRMLIRTGGGTPATGFTSGIHWHMNIKNEIWYIASDAQRQDIPWVRIKDAQGRVTEYLSRDSDMTADQIEKAKKRRMDCMDCHNRPSHVFLPPDRAVDQSLLAGKLDPSLPYIKLRAVEALAKDYDSSESAQKGIATELDAFYSTSYPDLYSKRRDAIQAAIAETQRLYEANVFPEMKVDWRTHPNNIGHFYFTGCFRCHDDQHVSREGKVISKDCGICHFFLGQEEGAKPAEISRLAFRHPVDIGDMKDYRCADCHTGGPGP